MLLRLNKEGRRKRKSGGCDSVTGRQVCRFGGRRREEDGELKGGGEQKWRSGSGRRCGEEKN